MSAPPPPLVPNFNPGNGSRLATDRFDFQAHVDGQSFNHTAQMIALSPSLEIMGHGTFTNVQDILAVLATLISAPVVPFADPSTPGLVQLTGDISGSYNNVSVVGLQGRPVVSTAPTSGQVLTWSGISWSPATLPPATGSAGGDLAGTYPSPTVIKLQGNSVHPGTLGSSQDGYALTWVNGSSQWQAQPTASNLVHGWATNTVDKGPALSVIIVASVTVTPAVTGKFRVTVTGYVNHITDVAPGNYDAVGIYVTHGGSLGPGDFTQFIGVAQATTTGVIPNDGNNLATVSYSFDYDRIPSPIIFPVGTPVTFNVIMSDFTGSKFIAYANNIQIEVQEKF